MYCMLQRGREGEEKREPESHVSTKFLENCPEFNHTDTGSALAR